MSTAPSSNLPAYFGRAWSLSLDLSGGNTIAITNGGVEDTLRLTFTVEKIYRQDLWWATISIFNLNQATEQLALSQQGDTVSLSAGYKKNFNSNTNLIFKGEVFQPMWERPDVVDFVVTLRCVVGFPYWVQNIVSFSQTAGATQLTLVQRMAREAHNPIPLDMNQVDTDALTEKKLPRAKAIFGRPKDYFEQIARDNGFGTYYSPNGPNLRAIKFDASTVPNIVYAPPLLANIPSSPSKSGITKQTIIGVPQQTQEGVTFTVLLDSDVQIGTIVKLVSAFIKQLPIVPNPNNYPPMFDKDGLYIVARVRHVRDTRGNDWYTEIVGLRWSFWLPWLNKRTSQ